MEDKKLDSLESLELISRMIRNTQNNLQKQAGKPFLIWGYTTLVVSLAVFAVLTVTGNLRAHYLWIAIPIAGVTISLLSKRKGDSPTVRTFTDTAIKRTWIPLTAALLAFAFLVPNPLTIVLMLIGLGTAQTGLIARLRLFVVAGFLGMAAAAALTFIGGNGQILLFAAFSIVVLVIPGHILNRKAALAHVQNA